MVSTESRLQSSGLERPVTSLRGVGAERAAQLARLEITTVEDLLLHRPRRYEDRQRFRPIFDLRVGEPATIRGKVMALGVKWFRSRNKSIFELILDDGSARLHCRWWNLPFMENYFAMGDEVLVYGKPLLLKPRTMDHPETEVVEAGEENFIHLNRLTPIYPLTENLPQRWLRSLIWRTLEASASEMLEPWPDLAIPLPRRAEAIRMLHFPEELADIETARQRLALDELIDLQRQIRNRRKNFEAKAVAFPCAGDNRWMKPFLSQLGFKLTESQTTVLRELRQDLGGVHPMRRLLQGDVGSGKTVVAACCALMALESGYNVALMAPTEILAEQHFRNFSSWFRPLNIGVELHTGAQKTLRSEKPGGDAAPESGQPEVSLVVGTHALLTAGFELPRLGLVIIDEQHKFGVAQREQLLRKGNYPHLLVMTATPIPRTLGLTLYGELDHSTITSAPSGRGRIKTFVRDPDTLPKVWAFVREKLAEGRQAYVVYPRVEESDPKGTKAVLREFENVQKTFAAFSVGLAHGRLKSTEKQAVMSGFRANTVQVLLATSLIEVGVDVANATVMVIENAEQFGLAQLHQLRGRIGRGAHESYCILVASATTPAACERLNVLAETTDGFRIAEADLKLRGPGELLGREQSGLPKFRFADLSADTTLVVQSRVFAATLENKA